jgi:hypothetical protein
LLILFITSTEYIGSASAAVSLVSPIERSHE